MWKQNCKIKFLFQLKVTILPKVSSMVTFSLAGNTGNYDCINIYIIMCICAAF